MAILCSDEVNGCRVLILQTLTHRNYICMKIFSLPKSIIGLFLQFLIVNDKPKKKKLEKV